ncbi:MDR family MFS transporter [Puia dinghuensis]|uniref:MFS transporter n=1 Tax=Puia dinghuensis TaxID=1792502 RepID=A0A8J2U9F7_9BACT|nr:MFS transporter [Puia dinghuensis]GGA87542.1 MFS transporter [Puia dinghuensis]
MLTRTISLYRDAYSGLSRSTWLLSVVMLVNRSGTMVIPFMTIYLTQPSMGYTIGQAGAVIGIFGLGAVCGGFLGGRMTDRFGFHRVQLVTLTGGGMLFILLGQMRSYPLICGCTFLLSVVNEAFRPANSTAIAAYSKEENRTRSYSLNRLAINLGWAVGGAIGGILASINYHLLFWVDGCTNLLAAFLLRRFLGEAMTSVATHGEDQQPADAMLTPYRDKIYLWFICCTILFATCFFQLFSVLPVYYKRTLHMPEYMIGLLMTMNGLIIAVFEMILVFRLEGRRENLYYIVYGAGLVGVSYLLLNILPLSVAAVFFCMVLTTVGEILAMPFMNSFWVSRTTSTTRGQYAGLYTIAWSTAQVVGPAGGAEIADRVGFKPLWWLVGGVCFVAAMGFRWLRQINK